jgi:hypothetical protein
VEAARAEVELTRAEMTETIDALQGSVDPETLKEQAKKRAMSTARDTSSQLVGTLRQNPVPMAVIGGCSRWRCRADYLEERENVEARTRWPSSRGVAESGQGDRIQSDS